MGFPTGSPPQRSPAGIATSPQGYLFGDYPGPSPFRIHEVFSDFDNFQAADWVQTLSAGGAIALTPGNGGQLLLTTAATGADTAALQTLVADFNVIAGARLWYALNMQTNDASADILYAGFANTFAGFAPTSGLYFEKASGAAQLNFVINNGGVKTVLPVGLISANDPRTFGFYLDGKPTPNLYVFSTLGLATPLAQAQPYYPGGAGIAVSASADGANPNSLVNLPVPATNLVAGFGIKAAAAAAKTMTVDYFYAGNEILRF
jgi:hypothetical protein